MTKPRTYPTRELSRNEILSLAHNHRRSLRQVEQQIADAQTELAQSDLHPASRLDAERALRNGTEALAQRERTIAAFAAQYGDFAALCAEFDALVIG